MSPEPIPIDAELNALAAALEALAPARTQIDRDRLMFQAGQAAPQGRKGGCHAWIALAATLGLVAAGEAVMLARPLPPRAIEPMVAVHERGPATVVAAPVSPIEPSLALGQTAYERRAGQVLRYGLDGLPAAPMVGRLDAAPGPVPARQLLHEEVQRILDPGDAS
jgi:hypothetical protein